MLWSMCLGIFPICDQCKGPLWLLAILNHLIAFVFSLTYCRGLKSITSIEGMDDTFPFTNPAKMIEPQCKCFKGLSFYVFPRLCVCRCVCRALAQRESCIKPRKSCLFLSLYITNTLFIKRGASFEDGVCLWGDRCGWGGSQLSGCLWPSMYLFTELVDCRGNSFCLSNLQIQPKTEQLPLRMGTGWRMSSSSVFFVYSMSSSSASLSYFCCSSCCPQTWLLDICCFADFQFLNYSFPTSQVFADFLQIHYLLFFQILPVIILCLPCAFLHLLLWCFYNFFWFIIIFFFFLIPFISLIILSSSSCPSYTSASSSLSICFPKHIY